MIKTHGLTHLSLIVKDPERSLAFYVAMFGVREYYRDVDQIQVQGPGPHDVIAFEKGDAAGKTGGISHFGFRLTAAAEIANVADEVTRAGGALLRHGEFSPGFPFAYVSDPDGYEIEICFE